MKTERKLLVIPDFFIVMKELNVGYDITMTQVNEKTKISYPHLHYIKKMLIEKEFITENYIKPNKFLYVTEKGLELIKIIDMLLDKLEIDKDKILEFRESMKKKKEDIVEKNTLPTMFANEDWEVKENEN